MGKKNKNRKRLAKQARRRLMRKWQYDPLFLNMDSPEWTVPRSRPVLGYRVPKGTTRRQEQELVATMREIYLHSLECKKPQQPTPKIKTKPKPQQTFSKKKKKKKHKFYRREVRIDLIGTEL